jgi:hypothetical protein
LNRRDRFLWNGALVTLAAWGCFQGMEAVPDYSPASSAMFFGGYALVGVALYLFFRGFHESAR